MLIGRGLQKLRDILSWPLTYFDDSYWVADLRETWITGALLWRSNTLTAGQVARIIDIGSWSSGLRPSSVDIDYVTGASIGAITLRVLDTNGNIIGSATPPASTTGTASITLTFTTYDIQSIEWVQGTFGSSVHDITNIVFNE